jgi:hypothetical protein
VLAVAPLGVALAALTGCDTENACSVVCPVGETFDGDGTCTCRPFDAGYCSKASDCPDAACPASEVPGACGGGQEWSTTICGCYPLPDGGIKHH